MTNSMVVPFFMGIIVGIAVGVVLWTVFIWAILHMPEDPDDFDTNF